MLAYKPPEFHTHEDAPAIIKHEKVLRPPAGPGWSLAEQNFADKVVVNLPPEIPSQRFSFVILADRAHVVGPAAFVEHDRLEIDAIEAEDTASTGADPEPSSRPSQDSSCASKLIFLRGSS